MSKNNHKSKLKAAVTTTAFVTAVAATVVIAPITAANKKTNQNTEGTLGELVKNLSNWIADDEILSGYVMNDDPLYLNEQLKNLIQSFINDNKYLSFKFAKVEKIWFDQTDFFHPVLKLTVSDVISKDKVEVSIDSFSWDESTFSKVFIYETSGTNLEIKQLTNEAKDMLQKGAITLYIPNQVVSNNGIFSVSTVGKEAFSNLIGVKGIRFTNPKISNLKEIKDFAFKNMQDLTDLKVPSSVNQIGLNPWIGSSLYKINIDKANKRYVVQTAGSSNYLYDKNDHSILSVTDAMIGGNEFFLNNAEVKSIKEYAFSNLTTLSFLNLSNTNITSIGAHSFEANDDFVSSLTKVIVPNSLTSIGTQAFYDVGSLNAFGPSDQKGGIFFLGDAVEEIGERAFNSNFTRLSLLFKQRNNPKTWRGLSLLKVINKDLDIEIRDLESAQSAGLITDYEKFREVFTYELTSNGYIISGLNKNNKPLSNIEIPNFIYNKIDSTVSPVFAIRENAFNYDPNKPDRQLEEITSIKIGNQINEIGDYAFANLPNLINVTFENEKFNNINTVPAGLFQNCKKLDANQILTNWHNIEIINENAFKNTITSNIGVLAQSIQTINASAFENTHIAQLNLKNAENLRRIDTNAFANNTLLQTVNLPSSLTSLGSEAFKDSRKLSTINLENTSIPIIESNILQNTAVASLQLPRTVQIINDNGLANMPELVTLYLNSGLTSINSGGISNNPKLLSLQMPDSVKYVGSSVLSGDIALHEVWLTAEQFNNGVKSSLENNKEQITILKKLDVYDSSAGFNYAIKKEPANENEVGEIELTSYKGSKTDVILSSFVTGFGDNKKAKYKLVGIGEKAFSSFVNDKNKNITSVTLPNSVSYINNNAFENLPNLKKINLENITKFGVSVFMNNSKLSNIGSFNAGLVEIPSNIFFGCSSLTNITLPTQLNKIGANAFSGTGLTTIEIPNSVIEIQEGAFANNNNLYSAKIGTGLTTIPKMLFYNSPKFEVLQEFNNTNVVNIEDNAFANTTLKTIEFPRTLVSIGNQSFSNTQLSVVSLPDSVNKIGSNAFFPNSTLTKLMISIQQYQNPSIYNSVKFNSNPQYQCLVRTGLNQNSQISSNGFEFTKTNSTDVKLTSYTGSDANVTIPDVVQDTLTGSVYNVTEIAENAFLDNTTINKVVMNRFVTNIGANAFKNSHLQTIEIPYPGMIDTIGNSAFESTKLTNIDFLSKTSIKTLSESMFANTTTLVSVSIPKQITQWNERVFNNTRITSLNLIDNRNINFSNSAFEGMSSLNSIQLPLNIRTITNSMFKNCTSLTRVTLPTLLSTIESNAFVGTKISELTFPNSITKLNIDAFNGSSIKKIYYSINNILNRDFLDQLNASLSKNNIVSYAYDSSQSPIESAFGFIYEQLNDNQVKITNYTASDSNVFVPSLIKSYNDPNKIFKVTQIDANVFKQQANNISKIAFDAGLDLTSLPTGMLSSIPNLQEVSLPTSLTTIPENMFKDSVNLSKVNIQDLTNLTKISASAFDNTGLTEIDLSMNTKLTTIDSRAFRDSTQLIKVTFPNSLTTLGTSSFEATNLLNLDLSNTKVTTIPSQAFMNNYTLESVLLPTKIQAINWKAFYNCVNISKVNYDAQTQYNFVGLTELTVVASQAFLNATKLTKVDLSQSKLTELSQFVSPFTLRSLKLPATLTSGVPISQLAKNAVDVDLSLCRNLKADVMKFAGMSQLTTVKLPDNVSALVADAFLNCTSLTSISDLSLLTRIEDNTFRNCSSLATIPLNYKKIAYIGAYGLSNTAVEEFDFIKNRNQNDVISLSPTGGQFMNNKKLVKLLLFPTGITLMPPNFLKNCSLLTFVNMLEEIEIIGESAYENCESLSGLFIHRNVREIKENAFKGTNSLYSITKHNKFVPSGALDFDSFKAAFIKAGGKSGAWIHELTINNKSPWFASQWSDQVTIAQPYSNVIIQEITVDLIDLDARSQEEKNNAWMRIPNVFEYYENGIYYQTYITVLNSGYIADNYNGPKPQQVIFPGNLKSIKSSPNLAQSQIFRDLNKPVYFPATFIELGGGNCDFFKISNGLDQPWGKLVFLGNKIPNVENFYMAYSYMNLLAQKKGSTRMSNFFWGQVKNIAFPYSIYEAYKINGEGVINNVFSAFIKNVTEKVYFEDIRMFEDPSFSTVIRNFLADNDIDRAKIQFSVSNDPWTFSGW